MQKEDNYCFAESRGRVIGGCDVAVGGERDCRERKYEDNGAFRKRKDMKENE